MSWVKVDCPKCDRCGHVWMPAGIAIRMHAAKSASIPAVYHFMEEPKRCAKCKSPAWNAGVKGKSTAAPMIPVADVRQSVGQSVKPTPTDAWAPGTSRKMKIDFLVKYGREPKNRAETDLYAKRGW